MAGASVIAWLVFVAFQLYSLAEWRDDTIIQIIMGFTGIVVGFALINYWLNNSMNYIAPAAWLNIILGVISLLFALRNMAASLMVMTRGRRVPARWWS